MFKNITAYKINSPETKSLLSNKAICDSDAYYGEKVLQVVSDANPSLPPAKSQWRSLGFATIPQFGNKTVFEGAMGAVVICVRLQERILPSSIVNKVLADEIAKLSKRESRAVHRKEAAQLKDEVIAELLPKAFIRNKDILVLIHGDWVLVDTGSAKTADDVVTWLSKAFHEPRLELDGDYSAGGLSLRPIIGAEVSKWLRSIALGETTTAEGEMLNSRFRHLDSVVLKSEGTVRIKDTSFDADEIQEMLINCDSVAELSVAWGREKDSTELQCAINDALAIKRLKFSDILLKQAENDSKDEGEVAHFDATVALVSSMLVALVEDIALSTAPKDEPQDVADRSEALKGFRITNISSPKTQEDDEL